MVASPGLIGLPGAGVPLRALGVEHTGRVLVGRMGDAMAQDASGAWWPAPPHMARFTGTGRRLLVEAARRNAIRNPRGEGARTGAGTSRLPHNWNILGSTTLSIKVLGGGTEDGIPFIDVRLSGTNGSSASWALCFERSETVAASVNEVWTGSVFCRVLAGSVASFTTLGVTVRYSGKTGKALISSLAPLRSGPSLAQSRTASNATAPSGTAFVVPGLEFRAPSGAALDVTLRIGAPQLEPGPAMSSPVLPPAGLLVSGSRAADVPVWTPPGGFGTAGTLVLEAMLPNLALFGTSQGLAQLDDGTDANRLVVRNTSGGAEVFGVVDSGGATLAALSGGSMTPGTPFRAALAWAPDGLAFCMAGRPVQSAAVALPTGLARLLVGHASTALNRAANGELGSIDYRPQRLPDAMLRALTAAA